MSNRDGRGLTKEDLRWIVPMIMVIGTMIFLSVFVWPGEVYL